MSVVDSGAPPKNGGFSLSRTWRRGVYAVVAIKVFRRGGRGRGGVQPRGCFWHSGTLAR